MGNCSNRFWGDGPFFFSPFTPSQVLPKLCRIHPSESHGESLNDNKKMYCVVWVTWSERPMRFSHVGRFLPSSQLHLNTSNHVFLSHHRSHRLFIRVYDRTGPISARSPPWAFCTLFVVRVDYYGARSPTDRVLLGFSRCAAGRTTRGVLSRKSQI